MPMKMMFRLLSPIFGVIGLAGTASSTSVGVSSTETISITSSINSDQYQKVVTSIVTASSTDEAGRIRDEIGMDSVIEQIGKMIDQDEMTAEEESQDNQLRNTKKRMWEEEVVSIRDEL